MASKGVNKVILVGNLGADPDIKQSERGTITNISIATSESWRDKTSGQNQERTEWHRVVFFGKLAEIAANYLSKGAQVYIEGKIRTRKWQDKNGQDRYITEVVANEMQMLGGRNGADDALAGWLGEAPKQETGYRKPQAQSTFDDEDVPF